MSSYPKWVYGPDEAAVLIHDESERPEGFTESPADWVVQEGEQEAPKRRGRKPQE
jgi:hypothetical protein